MEGKEVQIAVQTVRSLERIKATLPLFKLLDEAIADAFDGDEELAPELNVCVGHLSEAVLAIDRASSFLDARFCAHFPEMG